MSACPNCSRSFRNGGNGLAFHLTWCKPAQPAADPVAVAVETPAPSWHLHTWMYAALREITTCRVCGAIRPTPAVARAPRGRKLTRKERRARLHELLTQKAHKAPAARKAAGPKMPASTGKHARCVAHVPMTRTAPGVAYACFDVAPDADTIAERAAFVADIDASWTAHHEREMARPAPDGLVAFRYAETADDARADRWIDARVPGWRAGFNANLPRHTAEQSAAVLMTAKGSATVYTPTENSNSPREFRSYESAAYSYAA